MDMEVMIEWFNVTFNDEIFRSGVNKKKVSIAVLVIHDNDSDV